MDMKRIGLVIENARGKYMCDKCNDTGYIYFGDETFTGQEQVKCICKCCENQKSGDKKNVISRCNNSKWTNKTKKLG
jgi:hypothetical protein